VIALLRLALRNLLRARRRTLLTGGTMALGTAALVLGSGLADGIARQLVRGLVAVQTGHLQVVARPLDFEPQNSPFDAYSQERLPGAEALAARIESEARGAGVVRAVPLFYARGTAVAGTRSSLASLIGIDPAREPELLGTHPPVAGRVLPPGDPLAVYVAEPMAVKLRLQPGDSVSFLVQTPEGMLNSLDAVVCGVFRKGAPWHDNAFYLPLSSVQELFAWPGDATAVRVLLGGGSTGELERARAAVASVVGAHAAPPVSGTRIGVETHRQAGRFFFSIIQANQTALVVLSAFLFAAAAVGVVNSMLMSVHERTREIGTVRALGMRRGLVVRMFVLEGLVLGVLSAAAGVAAGGALVLSLGARGISMDTMTLAWLAGGDRLWPVLEPGSVARAALAIATLSMLSALYPARVASRLEPREALHHV
jgi:putative ABC transport system permease protein